jgi:hypothetical protein
VIRRRLLEKGQRAIDVLVGAKVIDTRAVLGAVEIHLTHRGCDDVACILVVPLDRIYFADEEDAA